MVEKRNEGLVVKAEPLELAEQLCGRLVDGVRGCGRRALARGRPRLGGDEHRAGREGPNNAHAVSWSGFMRRLILVHSAIFMIATFASLLLVIAVLEDPLQAAERQYTTGDPTTPASPLPGGERAGAGGGDIGRDVVRMARRHIGTPYTHSPPGPCRACKNEDCSCLTKLVYAKFGISLLDSPTAQWKYGSLVRGNLRPGDLVFFKENGKSKPMSHVGIYAGGGKLVHASAYFGKVVEREMKYLDGYFGARRLV